MERTPPTSHPPTLNPRQHLPSAQHLLRPTTLPHQPHFLLIRSSFRQYLAPPENIQHGIPAQRTILLGSHDRRHLLRAQPLGAEVRIQFDDDLVLGHIIRPRFG